METVGTILGVLCLVAGLVGSGAYAVLSMADFRAARRGFLATAIIFAAIGLLLGVMTTWPLPIRMFVCAAFFGVAGAGFVWVQDYLKLRESLGIADPQPDIIIAPPSMAYILLWDPTKQTFIRSVPLKGGKIPAEFNAMAAPPPPFRVKNLGSVAAYNVRLHWEQTMDEQQLLDAINKSEIFKKYPAQNDKKEMRYKEFTFQIQYLAPAVDNTSYINVPIPYYVYLYAETYFTAVISGDQLIKELITVPFRLTISWDRPPGGKPTIFVVTATARNMNPYPRRGGEQFKDENGNMHPLPKVMAEITFGVGQIAP